MIKKVSRRFSKQRYAHVPICIIGGGNASINIANQLIRNKNVMAKDIRVFETNVNHHYGPGYTMIGGGLIDPNRNYLNWRTIVQETHKQYNRLIDIKQHRIDKVIADKNTLIDQEGNEFTYDQLVIAAGIQPDFSFIKGGVECLQDPSSPVCSIYDYDLAIKTQSLARSFIGGNAIFTESQGPIKCGGAPQKIVFLLEDMWRNKRSVKFNIDFIKQPSVLFGQPDYAENLRELHEQKKVNVQLETDLVEIKKEEQIAVFKDKNGQTFEKEFEFLHVVPRFNPPKFIRESGLGDAAGYVDVDKYTLQHKKHKNIWSLGDCSSLPNSKTAAAVFSQSLVLIHNMLLEQKVIFDQEMKEYDGYSACPIYVGGGKLLLAEFKYDGVRDCTFEPWLDQSKPNRLFYWLKRYMFPLVYWGLANRGLWAGKKGILWTV